METSIRCLHTKALRRAGLRPAATGDPQLAGPRGLDFVFVAGRCWLRARPVRCGPGCGPEYVKICGAGRAAGRMIQLRAGAGSTFSARAVTILSTFAHCLCLLVGG